MESFKEWTDYLGAAIVLTIFGLIAISAAGLWPWVNEIGGSTWASWAQAIGGLAAVIVALSLAGAESRRKRKEAEDRASLVAAMIGDHVESILARLYGAKATMTFSDFPTYENAEFVKNALNASRDLFGQISKDDLADLVPLPRHAAHRLAKASALIGSHARQVERNIARFQFAKFSDYLLESDRRFFNSWATRISQATEMLEVVKQEVEAASTRGSPEPTHEELHGDFDDSDL